jgi:hypothetical protein
MKIIFINSEDYLLKMFIGFTKQVIGIVTMIEETVLWLVEKSPKSLENMKTYIKNDEVVGVAETFIYHIETYVAWKNGVALYDDKWYSSKEPLKFKKKDNLIKRKTYKLFRLISMDYAPESYLIRNGYYEDK